MIIILAQLGCIRQLIPVILLINSDSGIIAAGIMASSWAWTCDVSLQDICKAAGWASPSTFIRFYNLEVPALQTKLFSV